MVVAVLAGIVDTIQRREVMEVDLLAKVVVIILVAVANGQAQAAPNLMVDNRAIAGLALVLLAGVGMEEIVRSMALEAVVGITVAVVVVRVVVVEVVPPTLVVLLLALLLLDNVQAME